jgi:hypothetical protein
MAPEITLAAGVAIAGAAMTAQQLPPVVRAFASRRWVRAEGRILSSRVVGIDEGHRQIKSAAPIVRYEYNAAGAWRRGDLVRWDGFTYGAAIAARQRYSAGQQVTVWYDPARPERAVLEPGASAAGVARAVFAALVLLAGTAWSLFIAAST